MNINGYKVMSMIICFLLLLNNDSLFIYLIADYKYAIDIVTMILMVVMALIDGRVHAKYSLWVSCFTMAVALLISLYHTDNTEYVYVLLLAMRLFSAMLFVGACINQSIDPTRDMAAWILIFAWYAIICFILFEINPFDISSCYTVIKMNPNSRSAGVKYLTFMNIYYRWDEIAFYNFWGFSFPRINGFFREVGVAGIHYTLALMYYLFFDKKASKVNVIVLSTAVILARSTMGIVIMLMLYIIYFYEELKTSQMYIPAVVPLGYFIYAVINNKFSSKIYDGNVRDRQQSLNYALDTIKNNFLFGKGCNRSYGSFYGLLNLVIFFGIFGIIAILFMGYAILRNNRIDTVKKKLSMAAWLTLSLLNESIGLTLLFMTIYANIYYGYKDYYTEMSDWMPKEKKKYNHHVQ